MPAVVDPEAALAPDAPVQFEALGSNLAAAIKPRAGDDPLADAEVVVRARIENQRIAVMPMEGNAILAVPGDDGDGHDLTVYVSTQMPHGVWHRTATTLGRRGIERAGRGTVRRRRVRRQARPRDRAHRRDRPPRNGSDGP